MSKCTRCDGCGKIANSDHGEPWTQWLGLPLSSSLAVVAGIVSPVICPTCKGTGKKSAPGMCCDCGAVGGDSDKCPERDDNCHCCHWWD